MFQLLYLRWGVPFEKTGQKDLSVPACILSLSRYACPT